MCHFCKAREHLAAMKAIAEASNDPVIQDEVHCLENLLTIRQAIDQNARLCKAVMTHLGANAADRERFGIMLESFLKVDDVVSELSAKMALLTRNELKMSEATLDTTTGKVH